MALEARGFDTRRERTFYGRQPLSGRDWLAILARVALIVGAAVARYVFGLRWSESAAARIVAFGVTPRQPSSGPLTPLGHERLTRGRGTGDGRPRDDRLGRTGRGNAARPVSPRHGVGLAPTGYDHDPATWDLEFGRFDRERWREEWQGLFDTHDLVYNDRETIDVSVSDQRDGGMAVVDIDTLWRHRETGTGFTGRGGRRRSTLSSTASGSSPPTGARCASTRRGSH